MFTPLSPPPISLVPTCRKNQGFSASGICECILNKPKYGTNIRLPMQRYRIHLITSEGTLVDTLRTILCPS